MKSRLTSSALIVCAALLLLGSGIYLYLRQRTANPASVPTPATLAGQPRIILDSGTQAALEIGQLYGKDFPLTQAAVALYQGTEGNVQLWVAGSPLPMLAERLRQSISERIIANTGLPFRPTGERLMDGRTVSLLEGMGQQHFYFRSDNLVIWLAADPSLAEAALQQALDFYP